MTAVMLLSFQAYSTLHSDIHLADKQVEPSLSQKKMTRVKWKKLGKDSRSVNSHHSSR